jgi:hypothetical protein
VGGTAVAGALEDGAADEEDRLKLKAAMPVAGAETAGAVVPKLKAPPDALAGGIAMPPTAALSKERYTTVHIPGEDLYRFVNEDRQ